MSETLPPSSGAGTTPPASRPGPGCGEYEWMVGPLLDGELPTAETEIAERHLQTCASCNRLAEDFRSLDRLARRRQEPPAVTTAEWDRVWERIRGRQAPIPIAARRKVIDWIVPVLSLAALVLLTAWVAIAVVMRAPRLDPQAADVMKGAPEASQPAPEPPRKKTERS